MRRDDKVTVSQWQGDRIRVRMVKRQVDDGEAECTWVVVRQ